MFFGIPFLLAPGYTLEALGLPDVNTIPIRIVGAALIGIGGISLIAHQKSREVYRSLLALKIIWSLAAIFGLLMEVIKTPHWVLYVGLGIFGFFSILWTHYWVRIKK